nr:lysine-rich arabinogalactan protein 19-like [Lolium perenne]
MRSRGKLPQPSVPSLPCCSAPSPSPSSKPRDERRPPPSSASSERVSATPRSLAGAAISGPAGSPSPGPCVALRSAAPARVVVLACKPPPVTSLSLSVVAIAAAPLLPGRRRLPTEMRACMHVHASGARPAGPSWVARLLASSRTHARSWAKMRTLSEKERILVRISKKKKKELMIHEDEVQGHIANKGKPPLDASLILHISCACIIPGFIKCMSFIYYVGG